MLIRITALVLLIILGSCRPETKNRDGQLSYIPADAAMILRINNVSLLKSELKNNGVLASFEGSTIYKALREQTRFLNYIRADHNGWLAFVSSAPDSLHYLFTTSNSPVLWKWDSTAVDSSAMTSYNNHKIITYKVEDADIYMAIDGNTCLISSSAELLARALEASEKYKMDPELAILYQASNKKRPATMFLRSTSENGWLQKIFEMGESPTPPKFSEWMSLDLGGSQGDLLLQGIALTTDSLNTYLSLFKNTRPSPHRTPLIAPSEADAIYSMILGNNFDKNRAAYLDMENKGDTAFSSTEEIGYIHIDGKKAVLIHAGDAEMISGFLDANRKAAEEYQGNEIVELTRTSFLDESFRPLVQDFKAAYFTVLENSFVFASESSTLRQFINAYNRGEVFEKSEDYTTLAGDLSTAATIQFIGNARGLTSVLDDKINDSLQADINKTASSGLSYAGQIVAEEDFFHLQLIVRKKAKTTDSDATSRVFSIELDGELTSDPQFVMNHRNRNQEVIVQDAENYLYLISTEGKVLWKKKLKGRLQGKITQVDLFRNGRWQLAFTTDNQFLILDRNGDEISNFAKEYPGGNLNPLAVFDYENDRNYRFVVTQGTHVEMFNNKGRIVKGFAFTEAEHPVIAAPQHFRIGRKDYLLFKLENGSLKILSRAGKSRIHIETPIQFSDNPVMLYDNKFTLTDKSGMLLAIDEKGKISQTQMNLSPDHGTDASSKSLVVMDDNELSIKGNKIGLDLGVYTKPQLFYINDKIYVAVTDLQAQKAYLFDSNADPISNFPVFGASAMDMKDMDNDGIPEVVTREQENSLVVYKLN